MEIKNQRCHPFLSPSLTRILKATDSFTCLQVLTELIYEEKSYIFFIVNDQDDTKEIDLTINKIIPADSHWSFVVLNKAPNIAHHREFKRNERQSS